MTRFRMQRAWRWMGWALALTTGMALLSGVAFAAFPETDVKLYTGCLTSGGNINYVAEGNAPAQPCASQKRVVKLSGGDITSLTVTAPLTGGGTNGAVTIGLDDQFTLPASCTDGQVPKWDQLSERWTCGDDDDTTYTAGTGLDLSGGAFSVEPAYRLPQGCSAGQIAKASGGSPNTWTCASLSSGSVVEAKQTNFSAGDGIPDDGASYTYVTLTLPAGTYMVIGKAVIDDEEDDRGFVATNGVGCDLVDDAVIRDTTAYELKDSNDGQGINTNPLTVVGISDGGTMTLQCYASADVDQVSVKFGKLVAMRVA